METLFAGGGHKVGNNDVRFYQPSIDLWTYVVLGDISSLESSGDDRGKGAGTYWR